MTSYFSVKHNRHLFDFDLYALALLSTNLTGIYKDDRLACFENVSGPHADRIRKDLQNLKASLHYVYFHI